MSPTLPYPELPRSPGRPTPENIAAEWDATTHLPPDERERAQDILVIKHGAAVRALLRDAAIDTAPNVIRFADARTKLPKREG